MFPSLSPSLPLALKINKYKEEGCKMPVGAGLEMKLVGVVPSSLGVGETKPSQNRSRINLVCPGSECQAEFCCSAELAL